MTLKSSCIVGDDEKHDSDITFLLYSNGKLYSAADDGKIKLWSQDLKKLAEVDAHSTPVYCLAANSDTLFSCSNDGTIKAWELDTLNEKETVVKNEDGLEFWRLGYSDGCLFSGDDEGNISVYKDKKLQGRVNIPEPIKDMAVYGNWVFTAKDLCCVITEMKSEGEKIKNGTQKALMGKAPLALIGNSLFAFVTKDGKEIQIHENSPQNGFKQVAKMTHGLMSADALAGVKWGDEEQLFSGGWDKLLKRWKIIKNNPKKEESIELDISITAIGFGEKNQIFVGGGDGYIVRVDDS